MVLNRRIATAVVGGEMEGGRGAFRENGSLGSCWGWWGRCQHKRVMRVSSASDGCRLRGKNGSAFGGGPRLAPLITHCRFFAAISHVTPSVTRSTAYARMCCACHAHTGSGVRPTMSQQL